jgi:hypothetical protein
MTVPCPFRPLVDRHFAAAIAPRDERALRGHLEGCPGCRARYERYLLLGRLDRRVPSAEDRLARGLGLSRRRAWARPVVVALSLAAVLIALQLRANRSPDYAARGGALSDPEEALYVYRIAAGGPPQPVIDGAIRPGDELAFAYRNRAGWPRLLVYAIDDAGRMYWYHPGWTDAAAAPIAVAIDAGPDRHELPEAIAHALPPGGLRIHALFTDEPIDVQAIERGVRPARGVDLVVSLAVAEEPGR